MESFIQEQTRQSQLIAQTLQSALSTLTTTTPGSPTGWETLHTQIIHPAVQFANKLRLSTTSYRLIPHIFIKDKDRSSTQQPHATAAYAYEIKDSTMIDIATHKILRPDSALKVGEDGRIGEEVVVIAPALLRLLREGKGKVLVCKPIVLVKLDEPMVKRGRGIKALGAWTPSWFGGEEGGT